MLVIPTKESRWHKNNRVKILFQVVTSVMVLIVSFCSNRGARCLDLRGLDRHQFFAITECYHDREENSQECLMYVRAIVNGKEGSVMVNAGAMLNFLVD